MEEEEDSSGTVYVFGHGVTSFLLSLSEFARDQLRDSEGALVFLRQPGHEYQVSVSYLHRRLRIYECHQPLSDDDGSNCVVVILSPKGSREMKDIQFPPERICRFVLSDAPLDQSAGAHLPSGVVDFRPGAPSSVRLFSCKVILKAVSRLLIS